MEQGVVTGEETRQVCSAQPWLLPQTATWVPLCLYGAVLLSFLLSHRAALPLGQTLAFTGCLALLLLFDRWGARQADALSSPRQRLALLLVQALLVELAVRVEGFEVSAFLYLILPFTALLSFGSRVGIAVSVLTWAVFALKVLAEDPLAVALDGLAIFATANVFVLVLSQLALREHQLRLAAEQLAAELGSTHHELAHSHQQLLAYAAQVAELATTRERNRLARDIHDSLGHGLTAIAIQLEKARAFREHDAQVAFAAVDLAKRLADDALDEVRASVGMLLYPAAHQDAAPGAGGAARAYPQRAYPRRAHHRRRRAAPTTAHRHPADAGCSRRADQYAAPRTCPAGDHRHRLQRHHRNPAPTR